LIHNRWTKKPKTIKYLYNKSLHIQDVSEKSEILWFFEIKLGDSGGVRN
jgi:hypothetical protein